MECLFYILNLNFETNMKNEANETALNGFFLLVVVDCTRSSSDNEQNHLKAIVKMVSVKSSTKFDPMVENCMEIV